MIEEMKKDSEGITRSFSASGSEFMKRLIAFFIVFALGPMLATAGTLKFDFSGPTEVEIGETATFTFSYYDFIFDKDRIAQPQGTPVPETRFRYERITVTSWDGSSTILKNSQGGDLAQSLNDFDDTPENGNVLLGSFDLIFAEAGVFDVSILAGGRFYSSIGGTDRFSPCCVGSTIVWSDETLKVTVNDISAVPLPAGGLLLLSGLAGLAAFKRRRKHTI